jgi:hypothetical protein
MKTFPKVTVLLTTFTVVALVVSLMLPETSFSKATCTADCGDGTSWTCSGHSCWAGDGLGCDAQDENGKTIMGGVCM